MGSVVRLVSLALAPIALAATSAGAQQATDARPRLVSALAASKLAPNEKPQRRAFNPGPMAMMDEPEEGLRLPFLSPDSAGQSHERGLSFSLKPGKKMRAVARLRF